MKFIFGLQTSKSTWIFGHEGKKVDFNFLALISAILCKAMLLGCTKDEILDCVDTAERIKAIKEKQIAELKSRRLE